MSLRTLFLLVLFAALAVFTVLNWGAVTTPTSLSLGFWTVQAPLGLIMLVLMGLLTALFLLFIAYLQASVILDTRRASRELRAQRDLADQAEASRFTELRGFLDDRLNQLQTELKTTIENSENVLSAYIAEIEDRMHPGESSSGHQ